MRKIYLGVLAVALLIAIPAVVFATSSGSEGEAEAEPPTDIGAEFTFVDDDTTLTITGTAEGMEPFHTYLSLIYGIGSLVEGIFACEPDGSIPEDRMFVGVWVVDEDNGTGTLGPVELTGDFYVELSDIGTISVRGGGPPAGPFAPPVILCGEVESDD